jgi:beta-1,4-N-acetylglucosaminyltransferase
MKSILITVGTTAFNSMVKSANEQLQGKYNLTFQIADGDYFPQEGEVFRFSDNLEDFYTRADLVITHGGAGSVYRLLELGIKIVIVPNLERVDKHQLEICQYMQEHNHACVCEYLSELSDSVENAFNTHYTAYHSDEFIGIPVIRNYLGL